VARRERIEGLIRGQYEKLEKYESAEGGWGYYDFKNGTQRPASSSTSFVNAMVLVAFAEVQENLSGLKSLHDQAVAAEAADKAAGRAVELARARHDAGASSQLEVIDADRTALAVRRESARIQGQRRVATVQLVKALGGGWDGAALAAH
jgi:outer membrane protein TolC